MGKCANHPERETNLMCMKHGIYLCEDCIACRDPEIHCKFRSSCPIWFMDKRGGKGIDVIPAKEKAIEYSVLFQPDNRAVKVLEGSTLLDAAQAADIPLNASCNGKGLCGKCKLVLESGRVESQSTPLLTDEEKKKKYVLACQTAVHDEVVVRIPEETLEKKLKVAVMGKEETSRLRGLVEKITPMRIDIPLELNPPTLDDPVSDWDRMNRGLKQNGYDINCLSLGLKVMREMAAAMRENHFKITASVVHTNCSREVVRVVTGNNREKNLGLAIDVGTTSIEVYLVDMDDGTILSVTSGHNRQAACGDDVINRIVCAEKDGVKKLGRMVVSTINGLINEALGSAASRQDAIKNIVISGNTTMTHLLLQIEPRNIRREPYVPTVSSFPILKAASLGLKADPDAAVFVMPGPASYVGGDIVSGLLYAGFHREEPLTLFIDIGTNGEIVLGNRDWLMTASCSAGPAFEGGGVRWGMRAEEGAIEKVSIDKDTLEPDFVVVDEVLPRGICGSGMIDLIAEMLSAGILQPNGKFDRDLAHSRIFRNGDEPAYIVAFAEDTAVKQDILFAESDVNNIIRSKGAVYAGFAVLLKQAGLDFDMVKRIVITGGFGKYLDIEKAVVIGLLPDVDREKFEYLGNSSIAGAYMALLSEEYRREASLISNSMTYIDFSSNSDFMSEFTSALFLPHTNLKAFPSVKGAF
ncbi:MAG: ASKHA domain-containing protein [Desulfobacterales bacterium]